MHSMPQTRQNLNPSIMVEFRAL